jgi:hypothetical protein
MSRTYISRDHRTHIHYNGDLSGEVEIVQHDGHGAVGVARIPGQHLREFFGRMARDQAAGGCEDMTRDDDAVLVACLVERLNLGSYPIPAAGSRA